MGVFSVQTEAETGSAANTFTTLLGLKFAVANGAKVRRIVIGGAGGAAQDINCAIRVRRSNQNDDGTSTSVNVNTIGKADPDSPNSTVSAIGKTFTGEPTTKDTELLAVGHLNSRGNLVIEFNDESKIKILPTYTLCIEGAPGAATAADLGISVEWEE